MPRERIDRLPGMRDLTGNAVDGLEAVASSLRAFLSDYGYKVIDTPIIEDVDLFVRKSGGELVSRLYAFTDPGGRSVSLRPEFTPSVIRHFASGSARDPGPARFQYQGPVFRYGEGGNGGLAQFNQAGAELVGDGSVEADAEMVWLAWMGLQKVGLTGCSVRIGHMGALHEILGQFDLSEPARVFVIGSAQELSGGRSSVEAAMSRAEETGLIRSGLDEAAESALNAVGEPAAKELLRGVLGERITGNPGRRTSEQIVARLLHKMQAANAPDRLKAALELTREIAALSGRPDDVLTEAARVLEAGGGSADPLRGLGDLVAALSEKGLNESALTLDMGLGRGIAYYTGVVFEISIGANGGTLGGGGRYDGLVEALGGVQDTPAIGFAYDLDKVTTTHGEQASIPGARVAGQAGE